MRVILALVLSVILAMASVTEAVARSEMAGASTQELCGTGRIVIDITGKPLAGHPCTHCLAASVAGVLEMAPALCLPLTGGAALRPQDPGLAQSRPLPEATARGPPVLM